MGEEMAQIKKLKQKLSQFNELWLKKEQNNKIVPIIFAHINNFLVLHTIIHSFIRNCKATLVSQIHLY